MQTLQSPEDPIAPVLTLVVPVFNEQENIPILIKELDALLLDEPQFLNGDKVELIFIDDGSTDGSWLEICKICQANPRVKAIRFRSNLGKGTALSCAFSLAKGIYVISLDGDLQDDPREIPRILARLEAGLDVVCGWKQHRQDPLGKILPSLLFNFVVSKVTGLNLHDHNCGLKGYRKKALQNLALYGNLHRFITLILHARGFSVGELPVAHRPRKYGKSKYGVSRLATALADFLTVQFLLLRRQHPLHFFGGIALLLGFTGMSGVCYLALGNLLARPSFSSTVILLYSLTAMILAGQFFGLGLLGEILTWKLQRPDLCQTEVSENIGFRPIQSTETSM